MPSREDFDVFDVREWLGHLHLVQVLEQGRDFRYLVFGTELAVSFGIDLTGKTTTALVPDTREALLGAYREVVAKRRPQVLEADPVLKSALWRVEDLLLPLSSDGRRVDRLLIGAYPIAESDAALPNLIDLRSEPRLPVLLEAMLTAGGRRWPCIVVDSSRHGARLQFNGPVVLSARVHFHIEQRRLPAAVAWQRDRTAGLFFAEGLSTALA
jgi:hypothetical protein